MPKLVGAKRHKADRDAHKGVHKGVRGGAAVRYRALIRGVFAHTRSVVRAPA